MEGKTKTFSRLAGIFNVVAALFLILTLFFFIVVAGFGIAGADTSQSSQSSSSSSSEGSGNGNAAEEAVGAIAAGCATAFVMAIALVVALAVLLPLSLVNIITELVIGPRCFRAAPKRGTVIYSTVLKTLTIPFFIFSALMITAVDELAGSAISELFPSLIVGYLGLSIATNVFEWIASTSARKDLAAQGASSYTEV